MNLAEMPDLNTLEMDVKVEETDRGRIARRQRRPRPRRFAPRADIAAKLDRISPLAELSTQRIAAHPQLPRVRRASPIPTRASAPA